MLLLLTYEGTVLCARRTDGMLVHRSLDAVPGGEDIARFEAAEGDRLSLETAQGTRTWRVARAENRWVSLHADDGAGVLSALPGQAELQSVGDTIRRRERFTAFTASEWSLIASMGARRWVTRISGELIPAGAIKIVPGGPALRIGERSLDLSVAMPQPSHADPSAADRMTLFFDGWRVDELLAYDPLVYFVAFGQDWVFERLAVALRALAVLGEFDGDILVIGDRPAAAIAALVPDLAPERIHVMPLAAAGFVQFCAARYRVTAWPHLHHAPLLYMDIDVVVDRPLAEFLVDLRRHDRMTAQREAIAPLARSRAVGCQLFERDGVDVGDACGFNSGIIGIPDLGRHERTLAQIAQAIDLYARRFGPNKLSHFDQAIANYITFKLDPIDDRLLTTRTRFTQNGNLLGGDTPLGFVHFWGSGGRTTRVMARYVDDLAGDAERKRQHPSASAEENGTLPLGTGDR